MPLAAVAGPLTGHLAIDIVIIVGAVCTALLAIGAVTRWLWLHVVRPAVRAGLREVLEEPNGAVLQQLQATVKPVRDGVQELKAKVEPVSNGFAGHTREALQRLEVQQASTNELLMGLMARFDQYRDDHGEQHSRELEAFLRILVPASAAQPQPPTIGEPA